MSEHAIGIVVDLKSETCRQLLVHLCRMNLEEFPLEKEELISEIEHAWELEPDQYPLLDAEYADWCDAVRISPEI